MALLAAGVMGALPLLPPSETGARAGATEFSSARALDTVGAIAREPHPMGSQALEEVRSEIVARLEELGLQPQFQTVEAPDYFGAPGRTVDVVNVLARIPGSASSGAVALMGHYDSVPATPGANDNASAVAVILETARVVLAGSPLRNDLVLLFTDGEEPAPRFGSTPFVSEHPWASDIGFVVNLEAIGSGGPSLLIETNGSDEWIIDRYAEAVPYPAAFSFLTAGVELIGGSNTDFAPFRDAGVPGLEMAYAHGSPIYHTPSDSVDVVSPRSLQQHGANTLALARHLGSLDLGAAAGEAEAVFFTVGRSWVFRYPAALSFPLALLTGGLLAMAAGRRRAWRSAAGTAGATLVTALLAAVVGALVWTVLAPRRDTMSVLESYLYLIGLMTLTGGICAASRRWITHPSEPVGAVGAWWVLALVSTAATPGIAYLFLWPALAGSMATLWWSVRDVGPSGRVVGTAAVAATSLILVVPAIDIFYQFAQPRPGNPDSQLLWMVAVPVFLAALSVQLVFALSRETTQPLAPETRSA